MFDTTLAVARMCFDGMFREFPDIRWIVAHLGGAVPYLMERMDNGWRDFSECRAKIDELPSAYLKRLYYDTVKLQSAHLNKPGSGAASGVAGAPVTLQRCSASLGASCLDHGHPWAEATTAGALMGTKTVLNELLAYVDLAKLPEGRAQPRSDS